MASTMPGTVAPKAQKVGDAFRPGFSIRCRKCGRTSWKAAGDHGHALRAFRASGWLLGRTGAGTDVCPSCRSPNAKAMPKGQRIAAYNRIEDKLAGKASTNTLLGDKLKEAIAVAALANGAQAPTPIPPAPRTPAPWPVREGDPWPAKLRSNGRKPTSTTNFVRRNGARKSATLYLEYIGRVGHEIKLALDRNGLWMWWPSGFGPPATVALEATVNPRDVSVFREKLRRRGIPAPYSNPSVAKTSAALRPKTPPPPKPEPKEPAPVPAIEPAPLVDPATLTVINDRKPSRDQRRAILDELDKLYDQDQERYRADWSDQKLSDKLDLPRAWITTLRVDLYGDHDRNEASQVQARKLDEAIQIATMARDRLLEMSVEADDLMSKLQAARRAIG